MGQEEAQTFFLKEKHIFPAWLRLFFLMHPNKIHIQAWTTFGKLQLKM